MRARKEVREGCAMYAIVRKNRYKLDGIANCEERLREFNRIHAEQAGFSGSLTVDIGNGEVIVVNLWDSRQHAEAALSKMIPIVEQYLEPLFAAPSELLGTGQISFADLSGLG